jgi:hypothetical protein
MLLSMKTFLRWLLTLFMAVLLGTSVLGYVYWAETPPVPGMDGRPILLVTALASAAGIVAMLVAARDRAPDGR